MAQLTITTHDGATFRLNSDKDTSEPLRIPADGFISFGNNDQNVTLHVKSIATILRTKEPA